MKKSFTLIASLLVTLTASASTPNLIDVYHAALQNDPTFQQALANRDIAQQNLPLAVAALLPQISLVGTGEYEKTQLHGSNIFNGATNQTGSASGTNKDRSLGFTLSLDQTIFNFTNWMDVASEKSAVKAAYATYTAAVQTLIQTTVQDYFNVLLAESNVIYTKAEEEAYYRQYIQAKESFEVGVKTITDVYNAKASYDSSKADYVAAINNLADQRENLRAITGIYYPKLAGLRSLPLATPKPANINSWSETAIQHNWNLQAANYTMVSDHAAIKAAYGGHLPSLAFNGSYENTYTDNIDRSGSSRSKQLIGQLNLTVPIYSGGQVTAQVKQDIAQYDLAAGEFEQTYRTTVNNTRQAYLGAISGISKIQADEQAILSNQITLEGMEEGYKVGTQTMTDVLIAQQNLYEAQLQTAQDKNNYIMSLVNLKQAAGTLSTDDVTVLNSYLSSQSISLNSPIAKKPNTSVKSKLYQAVSPTIKSTSQPTSSTQTKTEKNN
ncbi:MAG: hypothetical protein A3E87_09625 [Gammaproteobacteria bacterium RIFCSPHIGHO2_12_FULL_35_23]|nr:MAG: hypothetical protein A3E87_09625 [Gammaproteobacteria bacterium RIFCSPHIGHO2_12_FULL_35_23]